MVDAYGQNPLLFFVVAEVRLLAEQPPVAHRFHFQLGSVVLERDVGAAHLLLAADFDRDFEGLPDALLDGPRRKVETHRRVQVIRKPAGFSGLLFGQHSGDYAIDVFRAQRSDDRVRRARPGRNRFGRHAAFASFFRLAAGSRGTAGIAGRLNRGLQARSRSLLAVEVDRLRNARALLVVETRRLRSQRRRLRAARRGGGLLLGDQTLLLLLLDLSAVDHVFDDLVHTALLRRPDQRQIIFRRDSRGADDVRRDGNDHVGLAGLLTRSREEPADQRQHPENRKPGARIVFDILIDAGDHRRHAILNAGHRVQRPLRECRRQVLNIAAGSDDVRTLEVHLDFDVALVGDLRLRLDHQADVSVLDAVKTIAEPAEPAEAAETRRQAVCDALSDAAIVIAIDAIDAIDAAEAPEASVAYPELGSESDRHATPDLGLVLSPVEHVYLGLVQKLRFAAGLQQADLRRRKTDQRPDPSEEGG